MTRVIFEVLADESGRVVSTADWSLANQRHLCVSPELRTLDVDGDSQDAFLAACKAGGNPNRTMVYKSLN